MAERVVGLLFLLSGRSAARPFLGMPMTMQYVVRNKRAIGFILSAGPKNYRAFNADGLPIGLFDSEALAARAVYQHSDAAHPRTVGN
jgi:hypothetical protein